MISRGYPRIWQQRNLWSSRWLQGQFFSFFVSWYHSDSKSKRLRYLDKAQIPLRRIFLCRFSQACSHRGQASSQFWFYASGIYIRAFIAQKRILFAQKRVVIHDKWLYPSQLPELAVAFLRTTLAHFLNFLQRWPPPYPAKDFRPKNKHGRKKLPDPSILCGSKYFFECAVVGFAELYLRYLQLCWWNLSNLRLPKPDFLGFWMIC